MKTFQTHDNGGRSFRVQIKDKTTVNVFKNDGFMPNDETIKWTLWKTLKPLKVFIGHDPAEAYRGNSILLQMSPNKYMFIGDRINTFSLVAGDEVHAFYSPIWGSDVAYPVIVGQKNTYMVNADIFGYYKNEYARERIEKAFKKEGFGQHIKRCCSNPKKQSKKDWRTDVELHVLWEMCFDDSQRKRKNQGKKKAEMVKHFHQLPVKMLLPRILG